MQEGSIYTACTQNVRLCKRMHTCAFKHAREDMSARSRNVSMHACLCMHTCTRPLVQVLTVVVQNQDGSTRSMSARVVGTDTMNDLAVSVSLGGTFFLWHVDRGGRCDANV